MIRTEIPGWHCREHGGFNGGPRDTQRCTVHACEVHVLFDFDSLDSYRWVGAETLREKDGRWYAPRPE